MCNERIAIVPHLRDQRGEPFGIGLKLGEESSLKFSGVRHYPPPVVFPEALRQCVFLVSE
jgi:hypothetical protein